MAFDYHRLRDAGFLSDTIETLVVNAVGDKTYIRQIIVHNTGESAETVTLYRVPDDGGAVGAASLSNRLYNFDVEPNATYTIKLDTPGIILNDTNDTFQGVCSSEDVVVISIDGGRE